MDEKLNIPGIWLLDSSGAVRIDFEDIAYCYHRNSITKIVYICGRSTAANVPLKRIEERLSSKKFYRCHRNYLVNIDNIGTIPSGKRERISCGSGKVLIARRRRNRLINILQKNNRDSSLSV